MLPDIPEEDVDELFGFLPEIENQEDGGAQDTADEEAEEEDEPALPPPPAQEIRTFGRANKGVPPDRFRGTFDTKMYTAQKYTDEPSTLTEVKQRSDWPHT